MKNRITDVLIKQARKAYERRDKLLRGRSIQAANAELRMGLDMLAAAGLCEASQPDEYGLVSVTTAQAALLYPQAPSAPAKPEGGGC
jgi:hypothetical protein